jgi:cytochrome P450
VTRQADIQDAALNPQLFANEVPSFIWRCGDLGPRLQPVLEAYGLSIVHTIATSDPPAHGTYRRAVARFFTPAKVKQLVPKLERSIEWLLSSLPHDQRFDFMGASQVRSRSA